MVWATATLYGITLQSFPASVALPSLVSETRSPTTLTVVSGASQGLSASERDRPLRAAAQENAKGGRPARLRGRSRFGAKAACRLML